MTDAEIRSYRLLNLCLLEPKDDSPAALLTRLGAVQAQDRAMAALSLALRLKKGTVPKVEKAAAAGEIVRTHILRPTWHFAARSSLPWLLTLSAGHIRASLRYRQRQLGLTEKLLDRSNEAILRCLGRKKGVSREEVVEALKQEGLDTSENRASHFLAWAEVTGLIASGVPHNGNHTYSRLTNFRLSSTSRVSMLKKLAEVYFRTRGPARMADFTWWGGLTPREAREGIDAAKIRSSGSGENALYLARERRRLPEPPGVMLLPAYDEYLISYNNRAALMKGKDARAISSNGLFRPTVLVKGIVAGVWKFARSDDGAAVQVQMFRKPPAGLKQQIIAAGERLSGAAGIDIPVRID